MSEQQQQPEIENPEMESADTESTTDNSVEPAAMPTRPEKSSGNTGRGSGIISGIALLLAAAAVVACVMIYSRFSGLQQKQDELASTAGSQNHKLEQQVDKLGQQLQSGMAMVQEDEERLRAGMLRLQAQVGQERSLMLASEAGYLLRVANYRLQLQQDVSGALVALGLAHDLLGRLSSNVYLPVRQQIQGDIQTLRAVQENQRRDKAVITLAVLLERVDSLPLQQRSRGMPEQEAETVVAEQDGVEQSWWEKLKTLGNRLLRDLVILRKDNTTVAPLVPPEASYYLKHNLRLELQAARLAAARGDSALYKDGISKIRGWIDSYFDEQSPEVAAFAETLDEMAGWDVAPVMPDISATLDALQAAMEQLQGTTPQDSQKAAAPEAGQP